MEIGSSVLRGHRAAQPCLLALGSMVTAATLVLGAWPQQAAAMVTAKITVQRRGQFDRGSLRSVERLRLDCRSDIGRREVTLFGNGTVRLREGLGAEERIWLHELSAEQVNDYMVRLSEDNRAETELHYGTVEGAWVERCSLVLSLDDDAPERYDFGRYDTVSLDLRRAVSIALEVGNLVDSTLPPEGSPRLPRGYEAKVGDVLQRLDGRRYRVVGFTWDGQGVELGGIEDPLTLYLPKDQLGDQFVVVESRRRR